MGRNELFENLLGFALDSAAAGIAANAEYKRRLENAIMRLNLGVETDDDMHLIAKEIQKCAQEELRKCKQKKDRLTSESDDLYNKQIIPLSMMIGAVDTFRDDPELDEYLINDKDTLILVLKKTETQKGTEITAYDPSGNFFDLNKLNASRKKFEERVGEIDAEIENIENKERTYLKILAMLGM